MLLGKRVRRGRLLNEELQVLAGKNNHYSALAGGKFGRSVTFHAVEERKKKTEIFTLGKRTRAQMFWELLNLRALGLEGAFIQDPNAGFSGGVVEPVPMQQEGTQRMCSRTGDGVTPGRMSWYGECGRVECWDLS